LFSVFLHDVNVSLVLNPLSRDIQNVLLLIILYVYAAFFFIYVRDSDYVKVKFKGK
jgi:hypothetical protein